jgi:prepilin-type processing-associated H-X9-DG protein
MTIVELLTVIGVIVLLAGVLLAALTAVRGSGKMADSQNRLRQIGIWVQAYATDNRETVLPSRFDYRAIASASTLRAGKVRAPVSPGGGEVDPQIGERHMGTWTDILWTIHEVDSFPSYDGGSNPLGHAYEVDSPDTALYRQIPDYNGNPFRSAADNTRGVAGGTGPTPFGTGAREPGEPGYFAANDFFDASEGVWWSTGQIRAPDRSLYVVDSFAGETIAPVPDPFDLSVPVSDPGSTQEVDLRYNGYCLVLFLDGHVNPEGPWIDLADLQDGRKIRVASLQTN